MPTICGTPVRVVVCFDNNERKIARRRTIALRAAGLDAVRLDLRDTGLRNPKGDLCDYFDQGGTADALVAAIRRVRRADVRRSHARS